MATDGASIGEVYVDVSPRATAFWAKFQAQTQAQGPRVGEQVGAAVGKGIQDRIVAGMADGIQRGSRQAVTSAARGGAEIGEALGKAAKSRIEAALKSLPDVKIDGDSSKLDKKIAAIRSELATLGKADIADEASQARLAALRTQLGSLVREVQKLKEEGKDIPLDLDVFKAQGEVAALTKDIAEAKREAARAVTVQVKADAARAKAELKEVQAEARRLDGKTVNVRVDADTAGATAGLAGLSGASLGSVSGMQALISAGIALGPAIIPAAAAAAAALAAIGPAALAGVSGVGVLALGIVPVVSAVKAMGDAEDAAGQTAATGASRQLQMASAIDQVRQAQAALANARATAADGQRRAAEQVADAERNLASAQEAALRVQTAVNDAREAARRGLEDLSNQVVDNGNAFRRAVLTEQDARRQLEQVNANPAATSRQREEAQLAHDEAVQQLTELRQRQQHLQADKAKADRAGVDGSREVVAATDQVRQANQRVADAQRQVADARAAQDTQARQSAFAIAQAQQSVVSAQRAVQQASVAAGTEGSAAMTKLRQAMDNLSPAGQAFATFLFGLKPKLVDLSKVAQEGFLPGLQAGLQALAPLMPHVTRLVGILATAMGDIFAQAGPAIAEFLPPFLDMIGTVAPPLLASFTDILLNLAKGFAGIATAFAPFAVDVFRGLADLTRGFADFGAKLASSKGFQTFMDYVTANGPQLVKLFGDLAVVSVKLLIALAPLGEVILKGLVVIFDWLAKQDPGVLLGIAYAVSAIVAAIGALVGGPITLAVAAVTLFAGAWIYAYTHVKIFHDAVNIYVAAIAAIVSWLWTVVIQPTFGFIVGSVRLAGAVFSWLYDNSIGPTLARAKVAFDIFSAVTQVAFGLFQIGVRAAGFVFGTLYDIYIKPKIDQLRPLFSWLGGIFRDYLIPAFQSGVDSIGYSWGRLQELAKKPVQFVVNQVVNPLIRGYNDLAVSFGQKPVKEIQGFAYGGYISGPGGPRDDLIPALLSNGEYVIPAHVVSMLGVDFFDRMIGNGGPRSRYPGDGSAGLAFADGGIVGFFKDVWGNLSNPGRLLKAPVDAALRAIPGQGAFVQILAGMGHKLVDGLLSFLGGAGAGNAPGDIGKAQAFVKAQAGKPYIWASAGPEGYDCSGLLSAAWLVAHGRSPYSHIFSTMNEAPYFPLPGPGPFTAGWTNPGERGPGGNSVGHTAGVLAGMPFESRGGDGVVVGRGVTPVGSFAHLGHFDSGGPLYPGLTLAYNGTGKTEWIHTAEQMQALHDRRSAGGTTIPISINGSQASPYEIAQMVKHELAWELS